MTRAALIAATLAISCIHDHYECTADSECDLGTGGRCEVDHHCTAFDPTCPTLRRYTPHSEAMSNACFDGRAALVDPCAPGQSPALPEGCAATVCDALPACCATGWSEACAVEAQRRCELQCDTRIAITATRGAKVELWDLRYDGTTWSATPRTDRAVLLAWLAPAPGASEPRLAGFTPTAALAIEDAGGEHDIAVDPAHEYHDVTSLDLDRDLRDNVVLDWQDMATNAQLVEVIELGTGAIRELDVGVSQREAWGDYDHDAYPDGVAATGGRYNLLVNIDPGDHSRQLDASISSAFSGSNTPSSAATRSFAWSDLDGDGKLDLVAFGNSLRVHAGSDRISDTPLYNFDCDPPVLAGSTTCDAVTAGNAAFSGAVLPADGGGSILAATFPTRALYHVVVHVSPKAFDITPLALPDTPACPACTLQAIVVRDLDGDHVPDYVVIDSSLTLFVALSTKGMTPVEVHPIVPVTTGFTSVRTSVTGALR